MGKKDREMKEYFSDNRRYADLWNGGLFQGRQLICPEDLRESNPVGIYGNGNGDGDGYLEHTSDLAMKQFRGNQVLALWVLENQENTDYRMPARVMVQEALQYGRQLKEIQRENQRAYGKFRKESNSGAPYYKDKGEFLYHFREQDRLFPVITLVAYWGEDDWKGPRTLHDMLALDRSDSLRQELSRLIPEYPLHLINLSKLEDYSLFRTELRTLLELFACRTDKDKFTQYLQTHDECRCMDEETCHALGVMIRSKELQTIKPEEKGDTINMCKAINDLMQDSRAEGEERMVQLAQKLLDAGQLSVFAKALKDAELRNQLFQQYQLL